MIDRHGKARWKRTMTTAPHSEVFAKEGVRHSIRSLAGWFPWLLLGILLIVAIPLFVCLPLWVDVSLYDVCARTMLEGGVHYRDTFDTNPPGMPWVHCVIRGLLGWRSETIRIVDLLVVGTSCWLLLQWQSLVGLSRAQRGWTAFLLAFFYLSTTEFEHCQRDVWMLLPALLALHLRRRQVERMNAATYGKIFGWGVLEGIVWASLIWFKPHLLVPILACWVVSTIEMRRRGVSLAFRIADGVGVLVGGLLVGGLGCLLLVISGSWPYFWTVMLNWDPEYVLYMRRPRAHLNRLLLWAFQSTPWSWLHLVIIPIAMRHVLRWTRWSESEKSPRTFLVCLASTLYLSWFLQAAILQYPHDYVMTPTVLLGIWILTLDLAQRPWSWWLILVLFILGINGIRGNRLFSSRQLCLWGRCWREGSAPALRDEITRVSPSIATTDWEDLENVADFLRTLDLKDRELTCFNDGTHPLYLKLHLQPSTPFLQWTPIQFIFVQHHNEVLTLLQHSQQRYVVSDLLLPMGGSPEVLNYPPQRISTLPEGFPEQFRNTFPYSEPVLFRSGRYLVHQVTPPCPPFWPEWKERAMRHSHSSD